MDQLQRYEIRQINHQSDEYEIVIHLANPLSEFANELGTIPREKNDVIELAKQIIREHYPTVKVTMVKVLIGGIAVTSLPLIGGKESAAQDATNTVTSTQVSQDGNIYYHVGSGDTLWIISRKFNTTVDNIKRANKLTSDIVQLNQRLIIPKSFHTVGTGDYLTVLAKNYGVTVHAIKQANGLTSDSTRLGQELIIPVLIEGQTTTPLVTLDPSPEPADQPQPATKTSTYTIVAGDTLSSIAKRFGTTVETLRTENKLTSDLLRIGQTLLLPTNTTATTAPDTSASTQEQVTRKYSVVDGDSLSVIAKRFGTTVDALKSSNHLTSDLLRIGQVLIIPTGTGTTAPTKEPILPTSPEPISPAPTTTLTTYTVVAGDNLGLIANRNGTTVDTLRSANNLTSDVLKIGQVLTIPSAGNTTNVTQLPPASEPAQEERATFIYSVRSGDSLSVIAKRFGVTVEAIRSTNNLNSDFLQVGQALTIPNGLNAPEQTGANTITYTTHTVVSGDNIWDLSIRYGIPQSELLRANNMTANSTLSIGQKLTIPVHNIAVKPVISERHGEYLDWWTEAQYVFTIGKTAKVTDFATGKSFYIKRTIGANHADSETVSVNDTNIAKSIWGGFSWKPRAVMLEVDGRIVAASMSFMPHEREYIANNGITGHFDVYFSNSTRHVDGKADASHQAQVERAAGLR
jgi:peptidoglycan DL-endopeptidase LytF